MKELKLQPAALMLASAPAPLFLRDRQQNRMASPIIICQHTAPHLLHVFAYSSRVRRAWVPLCAPHFSFTVIVFIPTYSVLGHKVQPIQHPLSAEQFTILFQPLIYWDLSEVSLHHVWTQMFTVKMWASELPCWDCLFGVGSVPQCWFKPRTHTKTATSCFIY